ncbi:type VI secretion system baseplate subunit TssG [Desulfatitalea alkaliphila]|uniref:Type VI secretion system baseplate subunit TssG n=1 Tax=Desulfatitalea alkaliphila TaxID=2929485 RepID=A0AA41RAW4_9BACT|nr:type VI secretion system baseplate subunit TssG [Desulfatitalea alkaliphila]MCJ8501788.1 type VI secretion system baseplate subunit TssG [Desulfatitalea alkaliphila]
MEGTDRRPSTDLAVDGEGALCGDLLTNAPAYAFFQAMRLLRRAVRAEDGRDAAQAEERIRIRPNLSLAFPAADIESITQQSSPTDGTIFHITANFLGLYGTASPLPTFYTEDLLEEAAQDESVSRDFLDIIHQRLYHLLFKGWLKYRQYLQVAEAQQSAHMERLYCLLGLGTETQRQKADPAFPPYRLLRYIGLFTQYPRSAAGLTALLTDALQRVPLRIVPCISRWATIPDSQRFCVGSAGNRIGMDSYLGHTIEDRMGRFRIQIGPLPKTLFFQFTPGSPLYLQLAALTALYVTEPLSCEVELVLAAGEAETLCLGDPGRSRLGIASWVFSEASLGEVRTRFEMQHP